MEPLTLAQLFARTPSLDHGVLDPALSSVESRVLAIAHARWPTSSLEIAEFLGHECGSRDQKRLLSSRIAYHVKKLVEKKKLMSKRMGNALIVWPYEVESLRVMREMEKSFSRPKKGT